MEILSYRNASERFIVLEIDMQTSEGFTKLQTKIDELVVSNGWEYDYKTDTLTIFVIKGIEINYEGLSIFGEVSR